MRNLFKALMLSLLTVFFASSVWALSPADHVKVAPNNKGDVLVYPFYAAFGGGFETKLTVVNTSKEYSTVAKLIVRSQKNSEELLDFLIYLSPADMWTGTLKYDASKNGIIMYSDDDSVLSDVDTWADETPMKEGLTIPECEDDIHQMGYVTVIEGWASGDSTDINGDSVDLGGNRVDKSDIKEAYEDAENYETKNILAGWQDFNIGDINLSSGMKAVALRDYKSKSKLIVGEETRLGIEPASNNNIFEVEAALSKDHIAMPYVNDGENISMHFMTFPTKLTKFNGCEILSVDSKYFGQNGDPDEDFCLEYNYNPYDTEENTPEERSPIFSPTPDPEKEILCNELNWVVSSEAFEYNEGWTNYYFNDKTTGETKGETPLEFTGTPAIPTILNFGADGLSIKWASWSDGEVTNTTTGDEYFDYQYSDTPNFETPE